MCPDKGQAHPSARLPGPLSLVFYPMILPLGRVPSTSPRREGPKASKWNSLRSFNSSRPTPVHSSWPQQLAAALKWSGFSRAKGGALLAPRTQGLPWAHHSLRAASTDSDYPSLTDSPLREFPKVCTGLRGLPRLPGLRHKFLKQAL